MLCGIDNIMQNIPHIQSECGECFIENRQFHIILLYMRVFNVMMTVMIIIIFLQHTPTYLM